MMLNKITGRSLQVFALLVVLLVPAGQVLAHKFFVTAWVEEGSVFVEAGFGDGSMARNAKIIVFDDADNRLLTAATNDQGEYSFKIPQKSALKLKANAGMGHQAEVLIPIEEVEAGFVGESGIPSVPGKPEAVPAQVKASTAPCAVAGVSPEEIRAIVEKSLDKKLRPIVRKLASKDKSGPDFKDIAAGIGYIFGLVGVGTYFNYRRKKQN